MTGPEFRVLKLALDKAAMECYEALQVAHEAAKRITAIKAEMKAGGAAKDRA